MPKDWRFWFWDTFGYDSNGDRIQEMFPWNGQQVPKNYGYNSLAQMTYFSIFNTSTNYTYSGTGQLMYENQGSTVPAKWLLIIQPNGPQLTKLTM